MDDFLFQVCKTVKSSDNAKEDAIFLWEGALWYSFT